MKAHIVENGVVVNTILVESLDVLPNLIEATEGSIGWLFDGNNFTNPTVEQESDILTPLAIEVRQKRDRLLEEYVDTLNSIRWNAMSSQQQAAWQTYRQALLDVPQQEGFPRNVTWPEMPE